MSKKASEEKKIVINSDFFVPLAVPDLDARGVIDLRDILYFISLITISLILAQTMLSKRNWQE